MVTEVGLSAIVNPEFDDRQTDREVSRLEAKIDEATQPNVDLGGGVGGAGGGAGGAAAAGGLLGGAAGGIARVALAGAVGVGLLSGINALANDFAPSLQKELGLVGEGLQLIASVFGEKLSKFLPGEEFYRGAKDFYTTALNEGLGVAIVGGLENIGEFTLGGLGLEGNNLLETATGTITLAGVTAGGAIVAGKALSLVGSLLTGGGLSLGGGLAAGSGLSLGGGLAAGSGLGLTGSLAAGSTLALAGTVALGAVTAFGAIKLAEGVTARSPFEEGTPTREFKGNIPPTGFATFSGGTFRGSTTRTDIPVTIPDDGSGREEPILSALVDEKTGETVDLREQNPGAFANTQTGGSGTDTANNDEVVRRLEEIRRTIEENGDTEVVLDEQSLVRTTQTSEQTVGEGRRGR
jgi:hypothetical protein